MSSEFLDIKRLKKLDRQTQQIIDRIGLDRKTLDRVFDTSTLNLLGKLISDKVIECVDFPISSGKEAFIFRAQTPKKDYVAVKIYRTSTLIFKHINKYIVGDPRFSVANKSRRDIVFEWARKEYSNLERLQKAKVTTPKPIKWIKNIVIMEYLGDEQQSAPLLKDTKFSPKNMWKTILSNTQRMYQQAHLVHADLSPYNILVYNKKPYFIDVGQAVLREHPQAHEFLKRDIYNMAVFFRKFNIPMNEDDLFTVITQSS